MAEHRYDEHGHLIVLTQPPSGLEVFGPWWAHVHESQALECAQREELEQRG